jgi:hypothetical protein
VLRCGGESGRAAVEISLKHLDERRFDRDPAVLAALAADMDDAASSVRRRSPMLARNSSSARSPASSAVRMRARSRSIQSLRRRSGYVLRVPRRAATESVGNAFGSLFAGLGRPTNGIGLATMSSAVYRKVHSTFHVDQHR